MSVQAIARDVRISSRKANLVASLVRGRSVADALVILDHTPKKAAPIIKKVIQSAASNATNNHGLQEKSLKITELSVGVAPALKRFRPIAMGRANPYKRHSSHIRVVVDGSKKVQKQDSKANEKSAKKESK